MAAQKGGAGAREGVEEVEGRGKRRISQHGPQMATNLVTTHDRYSLDTTHRGRGYAHKPVSETGGGVAEGHHKDATGTALPHRRQLNAPVAGETQEVPVRGLVPALASVAAMTEAALQSTLMEQHWV